MDKQSTPTTFELTEGEGPLIATAIHDGHEVRPEVAAHFALGEADRLREEDPFTGAWTIVAPTRFVARHSRFEVDLNRPRASAVYREPADAWGLEVWKGPVSEAMVARSQDGYDAFYATFRRVLAERIERHGRVVVLDLHSYNHLRAGPQGPPADPGENPEVNIGTGTMDRLRWASLVERFVGDLRAFDFLGRGLDVRENVKFRGGHLARFAHEAFPRSACVLSVEFKKFFMNEWTGEPDRDQLAAIADALRATVPGLLDELDRPGNGAGRGEPS